MRLWLCIQRRKHDIGVANIPGSPEICYFFQGDDHGPDCGWMFVIPDSEHTVGAVRAILEAVTSEVPPMHWSDFAVSENAPEDFHETQGRAWGGNL